MSRRKTLKSLVAMVALTAMLLENTFSVMASVNNDGIVESEEPVITMESDDADVDIAVEGSDQEAVIEEEGASETEIGSEDDIPEINIDIDTGEEELEVEAGNVNADNGMITADGVSDITLYLNTDRMTAGDSFKLDITGADSAEYDGILNGRLYKGDSDVYYITGLANKKFTVKAVDFSDGLRAEYSIRRDGNPQIALISADDKDVEKKLRITDSGFEIKGSGYEGITITLDGSSMSSDATYGLYIKTKADVRYDGEPVPEGVISGLSNAKNKINLSNLNGKAFTIYVEGEGSDDIAADYVIDSVANGTISAKVTQRGESVKVIHEDEEDEKEEEATKREYTYEDSDVSVVATLQYADAIPDDAEFIVRKVTSETPGYNYDAYIEALDNNADRILGGDEASISGSDVLLYDIAFYVVDEDGDRVELQPEEGSVKISINFKKDQLSDTLDAKDDAEVKTVHLPLTDEVKESVDTTAQATDINAYDIKVEVVDNNTSVEEGSTEFTLSDFSITAVLTNQGKMAPGNAETFKSVLGDASIYGIVANDVHFGGHLESTVAIGNLTGDGPLAGPKNDAGNAGVCLIGTYDPKGGGRLLIDNNGNSSDFVIYTTNTAFNNMSSDMQRPRSGVVIDTTTYSEAQIKSTVSDLISSVNTKSEALAKVSSYGFSQIVDHQNARDVIDLKSKGSGAGTYYIEFKPGEYASAKHLKLILSEGQNIIFNIPDTNVKFKQYDITIGNKSWTTNGNVNEDLVCQTVIFNCPNATTASTETSCAGVFVVPKATFSNDSVSAGWVVAKKITKIGGTEWHCVYHGMPPANPCSATITATKTIDGRDPSANEKFWFDLYSVDAKGNETLICSKQNSGKEVKFDTLYYNMNDAGNTYKYKVAERDTGGTYIYDNTVYFIEHKISYDKNTNKLSVKVNKIYKDGAKCSSGNDYSVVKFNNCIPTGVSYEFPVTKFFYTNDGKDWTKRLRYTGVTKAGEEWPDGASFTFKIEKFDGGAANAGNGIMMDGPMPEKEYVTVTKDNPTVSFGKISFNPDPYHGYDPWEAGNVVKYKVYMYKITEVIPPDSQKVPGVTYTTRPIYLKLFVQTIRNGWSYGVNITDKVSYVNDNDIDPCFDNKNEPFEFINAYYPGSLKVKKVSKDSDGTVIDSDKTFYVAVYRKTDSGKVYYGIDGKEYLGAHAEPIKGNSEITFKKMKPGYKYYVYESDANGNQLGQDETEYTISYEGLGSDGSVTLSSNGTKSVTVNNKRVRGKIRLIKYDAAKSQRLAGAKFVLYRNNSRYPNSSKEYTTDSNGEIYLEDLPFGTYYFKEIAAPAGYVLPSGDAANSTKAVIDSTTVRKVQLVEMYDEKIIGEVLLHKVGPNKEKLAGATFKIYSVNETTNAKTSLKTSGDAGSYKYDASGSVQVLSTDSKGDLSVKNLPEGYYGIEEVSAPAGYNKDGTLRYFKIKSNKEVIEIDFINTPVKASVEFVKVGASDLPLEGINFILWKFENGKSAQINTATSGKNGHVRVDSLAPGTYYFTEEPIEGYEENTDRYGFEITDADDGKVLTIPDVYNKKIDGLSIVRNVPKKGKAELFKYVLIGTDKKGLRDAEFELHKQNGSKDVKVGNTLVTDAQGIISVSDLEWGSYYFIETKAPTGFNPNTTKIKFTIDAKNLDFTGAGRLELKNTPITGYVQLLKVDKYDKNFKLDGVKFELYKGTPGSKDASLVGSYETVEGIISSAAVGPLEFGDYFFKEVETIDGYVLDGSPIAFTISEQDKTIKLTKENDRLPGKVVLEKYNSKKTKKLEGAEFELYSTNPDGLLQNITDLFGADYHYKGTYVTDAKGEIRVDNLAWGNYYFIETKAPKGYVLDNTTRHYFSITATEREANLTYDDAAINDEEKGALKLIKKDEDGNKLAGAKFILEKDGKPYPDENKVYETNKDGEIFVEDLPYGVYRFAEIEAPEGFITPEGDDAYTEYRTINEDTTVSTVKFQTVEKVNRKIYGSIKIIKVDGSDNELAGAKFSIVRLVNNEKKNLKITGAAGVYTYAGEAGLGSSKKILDTNGATLRITGLPYGTYQITEEEAPKGFKKRETPYQFMIKENNDDIEYRFPNTLVQANVEFIKEDDKGNVLSGAVFELFQVEGEDETSFGMVTADKKGKVSVKGLGVGEYYFIERIAPEGYELDETNYTFRITTEDDGKTVGLDNAKIKDGMSVVENTPKKGKVRLRKVIVGTDTPLDGAVFELYKKGGNDSIRKNLESVNGYVTVGGLEWGQYYFKEVKAPEGYVLDSETKYSFEINAKNVSEEVTVNLEGKELLVENTPIRAGAKLIKKDADTDKPVEGAVFKLCYSSDDTTVSGYAKMVTDKSGLIQTNMDLKVGDYYFIEVEAATGYIKNDTKYAFTVDASSNGKVLNAGESGYAINTPKPGKAELYKYTVEEDGTQKSLGGAKFELYKEVTYALGLKDWKFVDTYSTDENGLITVDGLKWGSYYFKEIVPPTGYKLDSTPIRFTIDATHLSFTEGLRLSHPNTPFKGSVELIKSYAVNGKKTGRLEGAAFKFIKIDGSNEEQILSSEEDGLFYTDSDGMITITDLDWGTYVFDEVKAPEGYALPAVTRSDTITIDSKNVEGSVAVPLSVEVINDEIYGNVELLKVDDSNPEVTLEGAVFELFTDKGEQVYVTGKNGVYTYSKEAAEVSLTTPKGGLIVVKQLPYGSYYFVETKAPEGFQLNDEHINFSIVYNQDPDDDPQVSLKWINSTTYADVSFVKVDTDADHPLEGCKFELWKYNGNGTSSKISDVTSGKDGVVSYTKLGIGKYFFVEIETPDDAYNLIPGQLWFTITDADCGNTVGLDDDGAPSGYLDENNTVINTEKPGAIELIKYYDEAGATVDVLPGAGFELFRVKEDGEQSIGKFETDANGRIYVDELEWGSYYFIERYAPKGYTFDPDYKYEFEINSSNVNTVRTLIAGNKRIPGKVEIEKLDSVDQTIALEGVTFKVYKDYKKPTQSVAATLITGKDGKASYEGLTWGTYTLVETETREGYILNEKESTFVIDGEHLTKSYTGVDAILNDRIRGYFMLTKKDANTLEPIDSVTFNLFKGVRGGESTFVKSYVTNLQGNLVDEKGNTMIGPLDYGSYYLEEVTPLGYVTNTDDLKFVIDTKDKVVRMTGEYSVLNTPKKGTVILKKVDDKGNALEGAEFTLYYTTSRNMVDTIMSVTKGEFVYDTYKTDENGVIKVTGLDWDHYFFKETKAAKGHSIPNPDAKYEFDINENFTDAVVELAPIENPRKPGSLELIKLDSENTDKTLEGAEFKLFKVAKPNDIDVSGLYGAEGGVFTTPSTGIINIPDVEWGTYYFKEVKAPELYEAVTEADNVISDYLTVDASNEDPKTGIMVTQRTKMYNDKGKGYVSLIKEFKGKQPESLAGIEFELVNDSKDETVGSFKTDGYGRINADVIGPLEYGRYHFRELSVPVGASYAVSDFKLSFEITESNSPDKPLEFTFTNCEITASAKFIKVDPFTNDRIKDIAFDLYDEDKGFVAKIWSNSNGVVMAEHLPMGKYYFQEDKESAAKAGYVASDDKYTFTITEADGVEPGTDEKFVKVYKNYDTEMEAVEVPNTRAKGSIVLRKIAKFQNGDEKQISVKDAKFELYKDGKLFLDSDKLASYVVGDEIIVKDLEWGKYYFVETEAPKGYVTPEGPAAMTNAVIINEDTVSGSVDTPLICQITDDSIRVYISKRTILGTDELQGAGMALYEADARGKKTGSPLLEWVSSSTPKLIEVGGEVKDGVVAGKSYVISETASPDGFAFSEDILFSVNKDGSVATKARVSGSGNGMTVIMDDAPLRLMISKKALGAEIELPGAWLRIMEGNTIVESWCTTGLPHLINSELAVGTTYRLEEYNPPKGYYTAKSISFKITEKGTFQVLGDAAATSEVENKESADGIASTLTMYDRPIRLYISKKMFGGENDYVQGAELALYELNEDGDKSVFSWVSPASGAVTVPYGVLTVGKTYKIVETGVPEGFVKAADVEFTVKDMSEFARTDADGLFTQEEVILDTPVNVLVSKKASTGEDELPGAKLQITDESGKEIVTFISGDKQTLLTSIPSADEVPAAEKAKFANCNVIYSVKFKTEATYILKELEAPEGYALSAPVKFTIDKDGNQSPSPVEMKDKPLEIKISKKDIGTDRYLEGAKLKLTKKDGTAVAEWESKDKPVLFSVRQISEEEAAAYAEVKPILLPAGEYILSETEAPADYKIAEPVTIVIDGADVRHDDGSIREAIMYDYKDGTTSVLGKKEWIVPRDTEGNLYPDYKYPDITIKLFRDSDTEGVMDGNPIATKVLKDGVTEFAFGNLERYRTSGGKNYEYTYQVVEEMTDAVSKKFTSRVLEMKKTQEGNTVVLMAGLINTLTQETTYINGTKSFLLKKDENGNLTNDVYDDITIYLLQNGKRVDIDEDGKEDSAVIKNGARDTDGTAVFSFKDLPKYDLTTGNEYKYTIEEANGESYDHTITYSENAVKIVNIPKADPFTLRGVKTWIDPDGSKRPEITMQLYRDGVLYKETGLNADYTFSFGPLYEYNLGWSNDAGDNKETADGHKFLYEVKEAGADGYDVVIEGSGKDMLIKEGFADVSVINTIKQEYIEKSGTKFWDDAGDPGKRPVVTVNLYAKDSTKDEEVLVDTYKIPKTGNTYSFGTKGRKQLPKYDVNGKVISYRIEEVPLKGYISTIKGDDIVNTPSKVRISKLDVTTHTELPGAVLSIVRKKDGVEVERWTSGDVPHYIEALEIGEVYTLIEVSAPLGYMIAQPVDFQVGTNGIEQKIEMFDDPIYGTVVLTKLDAENRSKLAGATFNLYSSDGKQLKVDGSTGSYTYSSTGSGTSTLEVASDGELKVENLPYGSYYFKEVSAPEGYELSSETMSFTIAENKAVVTVSFTNRKRSGSVILTKADEDDSTPLAGAVFELYSKTPRTTAQAAASTVFSDAYYRYGTYTTDSDGRIRIDDLPWDDYYFLETKAPEGYTISRDITGDPLVYTFSIDAEHSGTATVNIGLVRNKKNNGVLGERIPPSEKVSGVLGVRSQPKGGVLGTRVGPATGDASAIALWLALLLACVGTIVWLLTSRKKKVVKE
ncbi:MAG: Cna B-type domain-containing protein [Lachnospiraceae bacterium]|nr:Cna B-type domain-containing protein [Lachnospiraceae bacterium]